MRQEKKRLWLKSERRPGLRLTLPSNNLNSVDTCSAKIASRSKGGSFYGEAANFIWKRMNDGGKKGIKLSGVEQMSPKFYSICR